MIKAYLELDIIKNPFRFLASVEKFLRDENCEKRNVHGLLSTVCGVIYEDGASKTYKIYRELNRRISRLGYMITNREGQEYILGDFK
jgi:hypothetical protein